MNLIEQFGYEAVKAELKDKKWRRDNLHGSAEFTWHIEQHIQLLEAVLLQHRRQHNIFEVGDLITHPIFWGLFEVIEVMKHHVLGVTPTGYETKLAIQLTRHATDAEIKAGRRL